MMMQLKFSRLILFCKDVGLMQDFYARHFGLAVAEGGGSDWVVLRSGEFEIGLHAIPAAYQPEGKPGACGRVECPCGRRSSMRGMRVCSATARTRKGMCFSCGGADCLSVNLSDAFFPPHFEQENAKAFDGPEIEKSVSRVSPAPFIGMSDFSTAGAAFLKAHHKLSLVLTRNEGWVFPAPLIGMSDFV
jgi:hypothetical protein